MITFHLFFLILSIAKGFPSELEENDLSRIQNLSPEIKSEDSDNVDKIQEELKEQKTVFKYMISSIKHEMTEMKECLSKLMRILQSPFPAAQLRWSNPSRRRLTGPPHGRRIIRASIIQVRIRSVKTLSDNDSFLFDRD